MKIKTFSKALFIVLLALVISFGTNEAQNISAKGVSKITLKVGQKQKLYVKTGIFGTKRVSWKKVKWSSSNKKVATVSKKGLVRAKKKGKATITAKYGKKKLKCKVIVKANKKIKPVGTPIPMATTAPQGNGGTGATVVSNSELASKLAVSTQVLPDKTVLLSVVNNNTVDVKSYRINYQLKTASGEVVETGTKSGYMLAPADTHYLSVYVGTNSELIDAASSVISVTVENNVSYKDVTNLINVSAAPTLDKTGISITYYNGHTANTSINATIIFYDAAGNIVGSDEDYLYPSAGETKMKDVTGPYEYDDEFNKIPKFTSYQIYYKGYSLF